MIKRLNKGMLALLLALGMVLTTVIPVFAEEMSMPDISPWAVNDLNEGEKYGIFPMEWYYDGFRSEISQDRLQTILSQTAEKIASLELTKLENYEPIPTEGVTRQDVVNALYNIVAQYGLSESETAVDYFLERGILLGTGDGLALDRAITTEEVAIFATRLVRDTFDQLDAGGKGVAWKVENNGNVVYLLGSIHIGSPDLYPIHKDLLDAFYGSDAAYFEINMFDLDGLVYFMEKSMFQDGTTIQDVVSEETYEKLLQVLEKYGLSVEEFESYKPWSLASLISDFPLSEAFGKPTEELANLGIDMYFTINSILAEKPVEQLESYQFQSDLFDGLSAEAQEEYLVQVLDGILDPESQDSNDLEMLNAWFTYWKNGDVENFAESFTSSLTGESEFEEMLLGQRDIDMAEKIAQLLESEEPGTYFIVVGAGHYITDTSILYHLEQRGFEVVPFYE